MTDHRRNALAAIIELFRRSRLVQRWAPVFLWMGTIFYFSSRPNPLGFLPSSKHTGGIDKLAHIGEYAGLVALLHRALREQGSRGALRLVSRATSGQAGEQGSEGARKPFSSAPTHPSSSAQKHLWPSALIAFAYALFDETHQQLVPGRGFELADIGYDLIGIGAALGLIWVRERGREAEEGDLQALSTEG